MGSHRVYAFMIMLGMILKKLHFFSRLTYKVDQKNNVLCNNNNNEAKQKKHKDECNNSIQEESIKNIDSV